MNQILLSGRVGMLIKWLTYGKSSYRPCAVCVIVTIFCHHAQYRVYCFILYWIVLHLSSSIYCIALYWIELNVVEHFTILHNIALCCMVSRGCIALCCQALYCVALQCIIMYSQSYQKIRSQRYNIAGHLVHSLLSL